MSSHDPYQFCLPPALLRLAPPVLTREGGGRKVGGWSQKTPPRLSHTPASRHHARYPVPGCLSLLAPKAPGSGRVITVEALMNWGPVIKVRIDFLLRSSL